MIDKGGISLPVAFGLLPDKEERSYRIYYFMLLKRLSEKGIVHTLKSIRFDYKINLQRTLSKHLKGQL